MSASFDRDLTLWPELQFVFRTVKHPSDRRVGKFFFESFITLRTVVDVLIAHEIDYPRGLFSDEPRNIELWSSDEDTRARPPPLTFTPHQHEDV
ncbi:hypothetical protein TNCV_3861951 [Trichonephila clavipes]|nr:hypothetical protein TNCV_3861951 [Trichonephila clavipes]